MLYIIIPKPNMILLKTVLEPVHFVKTVDVTRKLLRKLKSKIFETLKLLGSSTSTG